MSTCRYCSEEIINDLGDKAGLDIILNSSTVIELHLKCLPVMVDELVALKQSYADILERVGELEIKTLFPF